MKEETTEKNISQNETMAQTLIEKKETRNQIFTESKHKDNFLSKKDLSNEVIYFSINQDSK